MRIPLCDCLFDEDESQEVGEVISSTWVTYGDKVRQFENLWAELCNRKHALAVCNGTASLILILKALGIGRGDKVLVPSLTFAATANAVAMCNAEPIWLDCDKQTWNVQPSEVADKISKEVKACLMVHLYGNPCKSSEIEGICTDNNISLIEDAAQAHGTVYKRRACGSFGIASSFSFYGNKMITTGEGGMVLTDNDKLAHSIKALRLHGILPDCTTYYYHDLISSNYMLSNLQGALGVAQTRKLPKIVEEKGRVFKEYKKRLGDNFILQRDTPSSEPNRWMNCILVDNPMKARAVLAMHDIDTRPFYHPCHLLPGFGGRKGTCPNAEILSEKGITLPSGPQLTSEQVALVCEALEGVEPWGG